MDDEDAEDDPVMSPTDQRLGTTGDEWVVTTSLVSTSEKASMSHATWLKKRWNRDQCPFPTFPPEKIISLMKRCRCEKTHPVTIWTKVVKVGAVKTGVKSGRSARKEGVSSMSRLPLPLVHVRFETQTICQKQARKPTTF